MFVHSIVCHVALLKNKQALNVNIFSNIIFEFQFVTKIVFLYCEIDSAINILLLIHLRKKMTEQVHIYIII